MTVPETLLTSLSITELGGLLRRRELSPTELARMSLERLDGIGRRLNAVVTLTEDRAMREARQAEAELRAGYDRGPLHGIPYGVKDLIAAHGYPTTWGAAPFKDQTFTDDAHVVTRLRDAGGVMVAKLAMVELAGGMGYTQPNAAFTGPGRNPWDEETWSGGSSSGSGSAVAAGAVPVAIGSETGGSIITPAAYCGVTGLRPTYGRVSRRGAMAVSWTLDKLGPICRSADDCGHVLHAIAGADPGDPTCSPRPYAYTPERDRRDGFRIGVLADATTGVQAAVATNFEESLRVLASVGSLETVSLPDFPYRDVLYTITQGEMSAAFDEFLLEGGAQDLTAPEDRINPLAALAMPAHVYLRAMRIRGRIGRAMDELLTRYDALVAPTLKTVASPIEASFQKGANQMPHGAAGNVAGLPGLALPNGLDDRGLPTSLSLVGRAFAENTLLAIANVYQQRTDWHTRLPPLVS